MLALVVGEGAGVDLLDLEAAGRADRPRLRIGPLEEHVAAVIRQPLVDLAVDDVDEEHPALRPVVDAAPRLDPAAGIADDEVLARRQSVVGHLDQHVVLTRAGPAAARALVGAEQLGQPPDGGRVGAVRRLGDPALGQTRILGQQVGGVALEPVVVGDHGRPFFRTRASPAERCVTQVLGA